MRAAYVASLLILILLCVAPVALVVSDSILSESGGLTLDHYRNAFTPPDRLRSLIQSLHLASAATFFALMIGVPYALFSARIRTPGRKVFSALYVLPLVLPPLLMAMGWRQFLGGAATTLGLPGVEQLLSGVTGSAFLLGFAYFPFVTLFARKAFLDVGAGLEEAARVNTGPLRAFLRVTLPLSMPSVLAGALFVFLFSMSDFSVVDYLSTIKGIKEQVSTFAFVQFGAWKTGIDPTIGRREAAALGVPVAALAILLLLLLIWLHRKGSRASIGSGHALPCWLEEQAKTGSRVVLRSVGVLFMTLVLLLAVAIPVGRLIYDTAGPADGGGGFGARLISHLRQALGSTGLGAGNGLRDLLNSLQFAAFAAALMTVLATILAHRAVRKGPRSEALLLVLAFLPLAFGAIAFGAGLIRLWNRPWLEVDRFNYVYETPLIVVLMLAGKYLPFAFAAISSSLKRLDAGMEEAAAVSGSGPAGRVWRVVLPLAWRGVVAGFVLSFVFAMREIETMAILTSGDRTLMKKIYQNVHLGVDTNVAGLSLVLIVVIALPFALYSLITARKVRVF